jgi:hypothetical protein
MATIQSLEAERQRLLNRRDVLAARYQAGDTTVLDEIQEINIRLREVVLEIEALQATAVVVSSGEVVVNSQLARDDNSNIQNPPQGPIVGANQTAAAGTTNAEQFQSPSCKPIQVLKDIEGVDSTIISFSN